MHIDHVRGSPSTNIHLTSVSSWAALWVLYPHTSLVSQWGNPISWWRHHMETFSALLAIWAGNSPVTGEFPAQRPVSRSFGVFFDLPLNKRLSKQSWGWWFETLSRPLWRHSNDGIITWIILINWNWWYNRYKFTQRKLVFIFHYIYV